MLVVVYSDREQVNVTSSTVIIEKGEVFEARNGHEQFTRKRVFDKGRWVYLSGSGRVPNIKLLDARDYLLAPEQPGKSGRDKPKINPLDVSLSEKISFLKDIEKNLLIDSRLSARIGYRDSTVKVGFENGETDLEQTLVRTALTVVMTAKDGSRLTRGIDSDGQRAGWEFVKKFDSKLSSERALRLLNAKKIKGGKYTVILDPLMVGTLIHEALGHMVEGDSIAAGASALSQKLGEQIASPLISVVDDGRKGYGSFFFDRDGSRPQKTLILDKGKLVNFLNSRDSAGQLSMKTTSNCRGEFNQVRMTNTSILPGKSKLDEMLDVKNGIYLMGTTGGTTSPAASTFNFASGEGFIIKNGEITDNIGDAMLSGDLFGVLGSVDMVGGDFVMNGGTCGKSGESVAIGAGGVTLRTKAVVGGSA